MAETFVFYVFSGAAILASALVIGQRNPMYSVLLLVASFAAMAGLFIQLDAPFIAVALMIVYAGAIMVLFLFVVMLLTCRTRSRCQRPWPEYWDPRGSRSAPCFRRCSRSNSCGRSRA